MRASVRFVCFIIRRLNTTHTHSLTLAGGSRKTTLRLHRSRPRPRLRSDRGHRVCALRLWLLVHLVTILTVLLPR
ncbi:hypothetical protein LZ32DRAFT_603743 [Colletotrichum eremochloae]|nr:hypothetical protein LZ32DRAFT_603743 [Colletotrichum eremochloae]